MPTTPKNKLCCNFFEKLVVQFHWMVRNDEGKKVYIMPHFEPDIRINYCPSCGRKVRDIEITEEKMISIINKK